MLFDRKIRKVVDLDKAKDKMEHEPPLELEKGDKPAIFLAALLVYLPVLIGFIVVFCLLGWAFLGF